MKLDVISIVILVFCLGVCISLFADVRSLFHAKADNMVAEAQQ
jgi:hypothetical protein